VLFDCRVNNKISNPPWVKFQSAGWVNFPSAPTEQEAKKTARKKFKFVEVISVKSM
jgi:hypothetical protein